MSRSCRKPFVTDGYKGSNSRQFNKRLANRTVRKSSEIADGKAYKKFFETWNICDYRWFVNVTEEQHKKDFWHYTRK